MTDKNIEMELFFIAEWLTSSILPIKHIYCVYIQNRRANMEIEGLIWNDSLMDDVVKIEHR